MTEEGIGHSFYKAIPVIALVVALLSLIPGYMTFIRLEPDSARLFLLICIICFLPFVFYFVNLALKPYTDQWEIWKKDNRSRVNLQIALAEQIVEMHGSFGLLLMEFREEFGQFLQFKTEKGFAYMRSIVNPEFSRCAENIVLWDSRELEKLLDLLQSDKKKKFWHTMTTTDFSYMLNRMSLSLEAMRRVLTGMVGDIKTAKDVKPSQKIRTLHGSFKDKFLPLVNSVILHCREIFRLTEKEGVFPKAELPDLPNRS